jgi:hypothetical protein
VALNAWYWATQLLFTVLLLVLLFQLFISSIKKPILRRYISSTALILLSFAVFISYFSSITHLINDNPASSSNEDYLSGVSFLENNTEPGAMIGLTGGGTTAYFIQDRTIVNLDGLINSYPYFQSLKNYQAAEFLDSMGLDYVFAKPGIVMSSEPYQVEFSNRLEPLQNSDGYTLYQYREEP